MQAQCPTCAQRIVVEDSRVPDRPFSVRCPKCQSAVKLPGRSAAPAEGDAPGGTPHPPAAEMRPEAIAQLRRELGKSSPEGRAHVLVAVTDQSLAGHLRLALERLGYAIESLAEIDDGARLLEQGLYEIVITNRTATVPGKSETLCQRVGRLSPEIRRRMFLALVGEEFRTGDGTQAFTAVADLVIHPKDVSSAEAVLLSTLAERARLYRPFLDARKNHDAGLG
jgi:predicted Zn finger-like uncharacterized protein